MFTFKSDVAPISGKTAGEHIVFTDDDGSVFINDSASSSGSATMIAFQSADVSTGTGVKPVYYYADGGLRINQSVVDDTFGEGTFKGPLPKDVNQLEIGAVYVGDNEDKSAKIVYQINEDKVPVPIKTIY